LVEPACRQLLERHGLFAEHQYSLTGLFAGIAADALPWLAFLGSENLGGCTLPQGWQNFRASAALLNVCSGGDYGTVFDYRIAVTLQSNGKAGKEFLLSRLFYS
jgi:hypothetical protein